MTAGAAPKRVLLRPAIAADAALLAQMHATSRASAYRGVIPDHYLDQEALPEGLALWPTKLRELADGAGLVLIAERDGAAIGFVCMLAPDADGSVFIDNLHALPQHKGSGAGSAMLDAAREWAILRGARQMHLLVLERNVAAIGFYEARGWRLGGRKNGNMGGADIVVRQYGLPLHP